MQKITIFVLLTMAALATATHSKGSKGATKDPVLKKLVSETETHLAILADKVVQVNQLDWKTINNLIDNKETILADKKVIVDGKEINKDYVFKLIGSLSRIDWEDLHRLLTDLKSLVMNEVQKQQNNPLEVADVLIRTERMKGVDWKNYFKSFAQACMGTPVAEIKSRSSSIKSQSSSIKSQSSSIKSPSSSTKGEKLTEKEETMLKIAQKMSAVNKINWAEYNTKS